MSTILVPVDFSTHSNNALKYACAYAEETHSSLIVFHSYVEPVADLSFPFPDIGHLKKEAFTQADKKMKKLVTSMAARFPRVKITPVFKTGDAGRNIVDYAGQKRIKLVIAGTTGHGNGLERFLFGSTTAYLIKHLDCRIMTIPPTARYKKIANIALATDLHDDNLSSMKEVIPMAKMFNARMMVVYVQEPADFERTDSYPDLVAHTKKMLRYPKLSFFIHRSQEVIHGLETFVAKQKVNMLCIVTRKRKFPSSLLSRSLANELSMTFAKIPLLVLHVHGKENKTVATRVRARRSTR